MEHPTHSLELLTYIKNKDSFFQVLIVKNNIIYKAEYMGGAMRLIPPRKYELSLIYSPSFSVFFI